MTGHLKKRLDADSKRELLEAIDEYRQGLVPLVVPLTLLRHHVRVHAWRISPARPTSSRIRAS